MRWEWFVSPFRDLDPFGESALKRSQRTNKVLRACLAVLLGTFVVTLGSCRLPTVRTEVPPPPEMPVENGVPNLNLDAGIFDWGALDAGYFLDLTDAGMSLIDGGNSEDAGGMSLVDGGVGPEDAGIPCFTTADCPEETPYCDASDWLCKACDLDCEVNSHCAVVDELRVCVCDAGFVFDAQEARAPRCDSDADCEDVVDPLATRPLVTVGTPVKRKIVMSF